VLHDFPPEADQPSADVSTALTFSTEQEKLSLNGELWLATDG